MIIWEDGLKQSWVQLRRTVFAHQRYLDRDLHRDQLPYDPTLSYRGLDGNGDDHLGWILWRLCQYRRRYTPGTDTWTATSTHILSSSRSNHTAVWTETEMIVWGGTDGSFPGIQAGATLPPRIHGRRPPKGRLSARQRTHRDMDGTMMIVWAICR